ncbi:MAG: tRNA pseudouridine synthase A [Clostridiales Family XIII bacterium]|nr:tRNA pseudouridine synthase A [Clostridiales Family XIII bacterium]
MARNILLTIEYDGSAFHGWQAQRARAGRGESPIEPGCGGLFCDNSGAEEWTDRARTVQGVLEQALSRVCGERIALNGTSRTDAGVHALGQAASFSGDFRIPTGRIPTAANNLLSDVRVVDAKDVPEGFHARFDAKGKTYIYRIISPADSATSATLGTAEAPAAAATPAKAPAPATATAEAPALLAPPASDIFLRNYRYLLNETPDESAMAQAAKTLVGTHDFAAFRTKGGAGADDTVRTITDIAVEGIDARDTKGNPVREIQIRVTGRSFMYNMVRIIVGTLVEIGLGAKGAGDMKAILESRDRAMAGHTAPASGLYLEKVYFS